MFYNYFNIVFFSLLFFISTVSSVKAISPAEKSQKDYVFAIKTMRSLRIIVENFASDEQKTKYKNIQEIFLKASEKHYAKEFIQEVSYTGYIKQENNYQSSVDLFKQFKIKTHELLNEFSKQYMDRTKQLLDSVSKKSMTVLIEYSKESGLAKYFYEPINPIFDPKPYNAKNFHYFQNRQKIEIYLRNAYKYLQDTRNTYEHPDFDYIRSKKNKKTRELNHLIKTYLHIINHCRQAKQNGVEIIKILKLSELTNILIKYNINLGMLKRYPIYDDRIPDEYKIDYIDNRRMLYKLEQDRLKKYLKKNQR